MELSDRMKMYENIGAGQMLIPNLPVMVRIDGKAFHSWTRKMERPYDAALQSLFDDTTKFLIDEANAVIGYTQSDEITLILWNYGEPDSQIFFNGRIAKLTSVLASMATGYFNAQVPAIFGKRELAFFDCRVWNVPDTTEAVNCLLWREQDATRNSIQGAAYALYSQNQLHGKNASEMQEMLWQKGINWNDYPPRFKRGGYFRRRRIERKFTVEEIEKLPPQHEAHSNPDLIFTRHDIEAMDIPPLAKIINRVGVVFYDQSPEVERLTAVG